MRSSQRSSRIPRRHVRRRKGYLYVAVLFTSLIIVAVVTASLTLSTASSRSELDRINHLSALRLAESELHRVTTQLAQIEQWRSLHTSGTFSDWISIGSQSTAAQSGMISSDTEVSQVRYQLIDADGDLADDPHDDAVLTAHARVGRSNVAVAVTLQNAYPALPILGYSATLTDDLELESAGTLSTDGDVQVFDDCKTNSSGALITSRLECSGNIQFPVRGDVGDSNLVLPTHDVVDAYAGNATNIALSSLPAVSGARQLQDIVLSSTENPFGTIAANGIYRIDAQGSNVRISHCRISATLILQNCPVVELTGGITWSFPDQADAILVTDGAIRLANIDPFLDEGLRSTNFNPPTTPYRVTSANTDETDRFPTEFRGIVYAENNLVAFPMTDDSRLLVTGALICRDLRIQGHVTVTTLPELINDPPIPFAAWHPMQFVRGSFRRVETP